MKFISGVGMVLVWSLTICLAMVYWMLALWLKWHENGKLFQKDFTVLVDQYRSQGMLFKKWEFRMKKI